MRGLFGGALLVAVIGLPGCVALDAVNAVGAIGATAVSDLMPKDDYISVTPTLGDASFAEYVPNAWRKDRGCVFSAIMVPYDRTWAEEVKQGDSVTTLPPELGKIAGYIAVVYRKVCSDQDLPSQRVLRAGRQVTLTGKGPILHQFDKETTYFRHMVTFTLASQSMVDPGLHVKPQWWPQVVSRLTHLAKDKPEIKAALAFDQELFIQSAPDQADTIRAAAQ